MYKIHRPNVERRRLQIKGEKNEEVCYKLKRHTEEKSRIQQNLTKERKGDQR